MKRAKERGKDKSGEKRKTSEGGVMGGGGG